jgi:bifunctional non-homologous end joining protein LigD
MAQKKGLEGIVAKKRASFYEERRSREWLKIKIRHTGWSAVVGGYTEPEGSRAHFGSLVLGLYDKKGRLIHVGQAGSGFDQKSLDEIWKVLKKMETKKNPFFGEVEALRKVSWVKPELVAEIEFAEWTGGTNDGSGPKLRAPVFLGLRDDKDPKECLLERELSARARTVRIGAEGLARRATHGLRRGLHSSAASRLTGANCVLACRRTVHSFLT